MPIIPELGGLRQEDLELEAYLSYIRELCLKKNQTPTKNVGKRPALAGIWNLCNTVRKREEKADHLTSLSPNVLRKSLSDRL
jgi:hypothetical protein